MKGSMGSGFSFAKTLRLLGFTFLLLTAGWLAFYALRSSLGSYHEIPAPGGIPFAVWFPSDFTPRQLAPPRPEGHRNKGRFAPLTQLPAAFPFDTPLIIIDRWLFHKTVQMQSGQGDMPQLYELSANGKKLIPVK
ncbi:hypothetical protein [Roseibacillus ishigakijimensis]|uniref:Uncharacterized protein n=1 Tax=Roseibacillus ishigakijimensis TaxID=454146 RepID=A0A934VNF6_9BACT|nr:hypothetical protein [Roseibacillus ishigakijimensis]MBK1835247.1 hypothetical protein [Roseibacillus ishigakijimensis]